MGSEFQAEGVVAVHITSHDAHCIHTMHIAFTAKGLNAKRKWSGKAGKAGWVSVCAMSYE